MYVIRRGFNPRKLSILFTFNAAVHLLQNKVLVLSNDFFPVNHADNRTLKLVIRQALINNIVQNIQNHQF